LCQGVDAVLKSSFCHIPGIGPKFERRLWDQGFDCWRRYLDGPHNGVSPKRHERISTCLDESLSQLDAGNAKFFAARMPPDEHWRLYDSFRDSCAYIDIESTGSRPGYDQVTSIALYDGRDIHCYVNGRNLESFPDDILKYKLIVSYNGKCFDVPFLEQFFRMRIDVAHIDLRFVLAALGYRGGLKGCERQIGIDRGDATGMDGYFAVLLWHEYEATGDERVLETLLAYNIYDSVNLEPLLIHAFNKRLAATPFAASYRLDDVPAPLIPYQPHPEIIDRIRSRLFARPMA